MPPNRVNQVVSLNSTAWPQENPCPSSDPLSRQRPTINNEMTQLNLSKGQRDTAIKDACHLLRSMILERRGFCNTALRRVVNLDYQKYMELPIWLISFLLLKQCSTCRFALFFILSITRNVFILKRAQ